MVHSRFRVFSTCIVFVLLLLSACGGGGGSDTSSGGGVAPVYVGTYTGVFTVTATFSGVTDSANIAGSIIIESDGEILFTIGGIGEGGEADTCSDVPPTYLDGNTFSYSTSYSCTDPVLGECNVQESGSGSTDGSALTFSTSGTLSCAVGNISVTITFTGTKQTISAAAGASGSSRVGRAAGIVYPSTRGD